MDPALSPSASHLLVSLLLLLSDIYIFSTDKATKLHAGTKPNHEEALTVYSSELTAPGRACYLASIMRHYTNGTLIILPVTTGS